VLKTLIIATVLLPRLAIAQQRLDEPRVRVRAVGPGFHVSQLAGLDVRLVSKLVAKGRARWTAYGVKLTGKGEPR
jgi:hypothetical protein